MPAPWLVCLTIVLEIKSEGLAAESIFRFEDCPGGGGSEIKRASSDG